MATDQDQLFRARAARYSREDSSRPRTLDDVLNDITNEQAALASNEAPARTVFGIGEKGGGVVGDAGVTALRAAIGIPQAAVGLADLVSGGRAGKLLDEKVGFSPSKAQQFLREQYSPAQDYAQRRVEEADGFVPTLQAYIANPSVAAQHIAESMPSAYIGGTAAKGLLGLGKYAPTLSRAAGSAIGRLGVTAETAAAAAGEGLVSAGQAAEQMREASPDKLLTGKQQAAALASGILTGGISGFSGKLSGKAGLSDFETMLAGGAAADTAGSKLASTAAGAAIEGIEEALQSSQEQILQNIAEGKDWREGVGKTAAGGIVLGGAMGAKANFRGAAADAAPEGAAPVNERLAREREAVAELGRKNLTDIELRRLQENPDALSEIGARRETLDEIAANRDFTARQAEDVLAAGLPEDSFRRQDAEATLAQAVERGYIPDADRFAIESTATNKRAAGIPLTEQERNAAMQAEQRLTAQARPAVVPPPAQQPRQRGIADETAEQAAAAFDAYQPAPPAAAPVEIPAPESDAVRAANEAAAAATLEATDEFSAASSAAESATVEATADETFARDAAEYNRLSNIPAKPPELPVELRDIKSLNRKQLFETAQKYGVRTGGDQTLKSIRIELSRIAAEKQNVRLRTPEEQARLDQLAGRTPERLAAQAARERTAAEQRRLQQAAAELDNDPLKPAPGGEAYFAGVENIAAEQEAQRGFASREGEDVAAALPVMMRELSRGTAGRRLRNAGESSSYPKWVQEDAELSKAGRKTIERVAELARTGGKMTERQIDLWSRLKTAAQKEYVRNPEIQQGVEFDRLAADGYNFETAEGGLLARSESSSEVPFSKAQTPLENAADVRAELAKEYGAGWLDRAERRGLFKFIDPAAAERLVAEMGIDPKLATDGRIEGFISPDGQVHLVHGNIAKGQALGVAAHELGTHVMRSGFTREQGWRDVLAQSDRLLAKGDKSVVEARRRAEEAGTPASLMREETVAYLSNIAPQHGIIRNLIAKLKQFMINKGWGNKFFISKLTAADLQSLAQGATKAAIMKGRRSISQRINEFSQSVRLSVSDAAEKIKGFEKFKEWFGDSEVIDDNDEPLVLYHGTKAEFNIFDKSKIRSNTEHPTSILGFFFVPDKKEAEVYSGEDGKIVPVYVKIENPYEINNAEFAEKFFEFGRPDLNNSVEEAKDAFRSYDDYRYENLYPTTEIGDFSFTEITEDGPVSIGFDDLPSELQDVVNKIAEDTYSYENWDFRDTFSNEDLLEKVKEFKDELISNGHDGIIIRAESSTDYVELEYDTYIAFEPNQIKSIYNTGTWDSTNPDIRFSISKKITPDLRVEAQNKKGETVTRPLTAKALVEQKPLAPVKEAVERRVAELRSGLTEGDMLARKIEEEAQKKVNPRKQAKVEKDLLDQVRVFRKQHLQPEIQDMANEIFGIIDPEARRMTPAKESDLKATRAEIERLKAEGADIDPALEAKVARLDRKRIGDMLPGEAQALLDVANELAYVNKTKNKLLAVERGKDAADLANGIIAPIEAKPSKRYTEAKRTGQKAERGKNPILDLGRQLLGDPASTFKTLMLDLGRANEKSSAYRLAQTVSERQNIELKHRKELDEQLKKNIGNWQELAESKAWNAEQDVNGRKLTSGEKVYLKYSLNDKNVSDSIEKMGYRKKFDTKATKMSRAEREAIKLTPEEQKVYDALAEYFESTYQVLNPAHVEMKGWTLPAAGRGKYLPKSVSNLTLADELGSIIRSGSVENTGVVQDRIGTLNEINLKDIFEVITRQRDIASKYAAYAPMVRDFNLVFRSPELKNTLQMEYGVEKNGKSIVENYVDDLLRDLQGNKPQSDSGVEAAVRKVRTNAAGALLAFRLTTPLMQMTGYPRALAHISPQNLAKALRMRGGFEEAVKWNMRAYARRDAGIDREIADNRNKRLIRLGMEGIQKMDELVTGRLWSATKLQTAQETGLRGDELLAETSKRFDAVLDTQGGHTMADLSMTSRTQSELAKMFTIFSSDKFAMLNEIKRGLIIKQHTGDWKPLARASAGMVLSAAMAAGVATAVGGAVSGKDKDYEEEFVKNLAGSLPLFDQLVSMFQGFNPSSAGIEAIGDAANAAGRIASLAKKQASGETVTAEQYSKALQSVVNSASLAAGVPVKNITDNLGFAKRLALGKDPLDQVESELRGLEDFDFDKRKAKVTKGKQGAELRAALSKLRAEFADLDQEKVAAARRLKLARKRIKEIDKLLEGEVPAALRLRREKLREEIAAREVSRE